MMVMSDGTSTRGLNVFLNKDQVKKAWNEAIGSLRPTAEAFAVEFTRLIEDQNRLGVGLGELVAEPPKRSNYRELTWSATVGGHKLGVEFHPKKGRSWADYGPLPGFVAKLSSGVYGVRGQVYQSATPDGFNLGRMAAKLLSILEETKRKAAKEKAEDDDIRAKRDVIDRIEDRFKDGGLPIRFGVQAGRGVGTVSLLLDDLTEAHAAALLELIRSNMDKFE